MRKSVFQILSTESDTFSVMCSSQMATYHIGQNNLFGCTVTPSLLQHTNTSHNMNDYKKKV